MTKTIFSKLIIVFVSVFFLSFAAEAIMLYLFLGSFLSEEKVMVLNQTADRINEFLDIYIENQDNPLAEVMLGNIIQSYGRNTNSIIWVIDKDGYVVIPNNLMISPSIREKLIDSEGKLRLFDERQYKKVISGTESLVVEEGSFYGLFEETKMPWLIVQKPFLKSLNVKGAVFLCTPIPEVEKARTSVFKLFLVSVIISAIISVVLIYIFSLRISKPLKEMKNAVKNITEGNFEKRLKITSKDEIGELSQNFNNMAVALGNLEEMRKGFIANVSHELRTPMTSIRGFIDGILDGTIPREKQGDYLIIVKDEIVRLNKLVNDLMELAKMESRQFKLNCTSFDINELIRNCIIKMENIIIKKRLDVEADFEEELKVFADKDAIERVLINLIDNATKFTEERGKIKISTQTDKNNALIAVQDNGIGIDIGEIEAVWERFFKSDKSRAKDIGAGLGLSIVRNIIHEHGQNIWVESQKGEGSIFYFTLKKANEI